MRLFSESQNLVELVGIEPASSLETTEVIDFLQKRTMPRMPGMPQIPEPPNSLYGYCTVISPNSTTCEWCDFSVEA
jgi:hypothetical protein